VILLFLCLCVPVTLFAWRLCVVAGAADDRMEAAFQQMIREQKADSQITGTDPPAKEAVNAG